MEQYGDPSDIGTTGIGTGYGWLWAALILCLVVVVVLAVVVVRQRRLIERKNRYIVRYVGQYFSLKYKEFPELCKWYGENELTQMELIKIMHLLKKMLYACVLLVPVWPLSAQDGGRATLEKAVPSWYVGVSGGVPFGVSMFSSFGADKTRAGYAVGVYGGRRFNPVLSLEAQAAWGKVNQGAQSCCADYWLGADGFRYEVPVAGMPGWSYAGLKSSTFVQRYGVQLNVGLLGFFNRMKYSRWTLELSPHISAIGTQSDIQAGSGGKTVREGDTRWHFGVGGNLQAGYQLCRHLNIGIYSGITCLTGNPMDGMPAYRHKANYIWESGVRLGFTFGKNRKQTSSPSLTLPRWEGIPTDEENPSPSAAEAASACEDDVSSLVKEVEEAFSEVSVEGTAAEALSFPTIYFPFNGTSIPPSELAKARRIFDLLREHPEVRVTVTGWCDTYGSRAVNNRISLRRAEAVKAWLVAQGIGEERITAVGKGSDVNAASAKEARRADTEEQKRE